MNKPENLPIWSLPSADVLRLYETTAEGLGEAEAAARLKAFGENTIKAHKKATPLLLFFKQFQNPIILILLIATGISASTGDLYDSLIILAIIVGSALLSFLQEYSASHAVEELRSRIRIKSNLIRGGKTLEVFSSAVTLGDIVTLSAGSLIPADGLVLACNDFFVNQSILTGESFPVEKKGGARSRGRFD